MGFEHHTEKASGSEYHIWFYPSEERENNRMSYEKNWKNKAQGFQTVDVAIYGAASLKGWKKVLLQR